MFHSGSDGFVHFNKCAKGFQVIFFESGSERIAVLLLTWLGGSGGLACNNCCCFFSGGKKMLEFLLGNAKGIFQSQFLPHFLESFLFLKMSSEARVPLQISQHSAAKLVSSASAEPPWSLVTSSFEVAGYMEAPRSLITRASVEPLRSRPTNWYLCAHVHVHVCLGGRGRLFHFFTVD